MNDEGLTLDPDRCVLILQDLQNDVMIEGGAFADSGAPQHAKEQNVVDNVKRLGAAARPWAPGGRFVWAASAAGSLRSLHSCDGRFDLGPGLQRERRAQGRERLVEASEPLEHQAAPEVE